MVVIHGIFGKIMQEDYTILVTNSILNGSLKCKGSEIQIWIFGQMQQIWDFILFSGPTGNTVFILIFIAV